MRGSLARHVERLRQEIFELIEPLTAEAAKVLEQVLGVGGLALRKRSLLDLHYDIEQARCKC